MALRIHRFAPVSEERGADLAAIIALLGAAIMYLVVRSRHVEVFNGVDIASEGGWQRLERAVTAICEGCLNHEVGGGI